MITINQHSDIGYLVSLNGTVLPLRPIQVDKDIQKNGVKYRKGEILYIHDQIIRYYILRGFIKDSEYLLQETPFRLFCGLSNVGITVMIRAMHQFQVFMTDRVTKREYQSISTIQTELQEPIKNIARPYFNGIDYKIETFPDLKTAIHVINTRYKEEKGGKTKKYGI